MNSTGKLAQLRKNKVSIFDTDVALFDLGLSILGMFLIGYYLAKKNNKGIILILGVLALTLPIGIITHKLFNVDTALGRRFDQSNNVKLYITGFAVIGIILIYSSFCN